MSVTVVHTPMKFLDYNSISIRLDALAEKVQHNFDSLVIIVRGGSFAGFHMAFATGLPHYLIQYDRATATPFWVGDKPSDGDRVLICEDLAGSGRTLSDCKQFIQDGGYRVSTLVVFKDRYSAISSEYCCFDFHNSDTRIVLPWERYRVNLMANDIVHDGRADHEYHKTGWDMDGVLLHDVDTEFWRADHAAALALRDTYPIAEFAPALPEGDVIITGRPVIDKDRTEKWLRDNEIDNLVFFRDDAVERPTAESTARWKGAKALELGCTHYVESDARQAVFIASFYPLLQVRWWNDGNPIVVSSSAF